MIRKALFSGLAKHTPEISQVTVLMWKKLAQEQKVKEEQKPFSLDIPVANRYTDISLS